MNEDVFIEQITRIGLGFYHSGFFAGLKFLLAIYAWVLFIDIILILALKGLGADYRILMTGANIPATSKTAMQKSWEKIKGRMATGNPSQFKVAILEADKVVDEIMSGIGYKGENMGERLDKVQPGQIENLDKIKEAHLLRNRIVYEKDFQIDEKLAGETIQEYEAFLKEIQFL